MLDIEIILVNDFSTDNTLLTIQKLKDEDPRIKIINNEKNMGILYSRSIGVLKAKGKYILALDQDDFFLMKDYLMNYMKKQKKEILILFLLWI
jgi:glycosyltransferase involved in cell wall biosynthesis